MYQHLLIILFMVKQCVPLLDIIPHVSSSIVYNAKQMMMHMLGAMPNKLFGSKSFFEFQVTLIEILSNNGTIN